MVGNFFLAIRRDIGDHPAQFLGGQNVNIVDSNSITNHTAKLREGLENSPRDRCPLHQKYIRSATSFDYFVLAFAGWVDLF
jgi:hypothetical protein